MPEAEDCFQAIFEAIPECVTIVSPDGTLLHINASGLAMLGAGRAEDVMGRNVFDLIAPEHRSRFRDFHEMICRGGRGSLDFDVVGLQGARRQIESHAAPLRRKDGTTVHLALARDVTIRNRDEGATLLLGAIVDSSDDAIVSKDLNGIITSWNKGAERLFGYTAAETLGQPIMILIPPDRLNEEPKILDSLRRGERVDHFETLRQRKDGTLIDISLTISPVKDKDGRVIGASKIARDITERKLSEQAIATLVRDQKRIEAELRRANKDLEQFAYSASHDLKEPLRNVQIYSELLARRLGTQLGDDVKECVEHLRTGAARMEALVRDLLAYTQVMKFEPSAETADAGAALALALANLARGISESSARVSSDPLPSPRIHGAHLQQLFQNMIGNSIKYRRPGEPPIIHITAERKMEFWLFSVIDNGIGIAMEHREKIFGLFKRLHTRDDFAGTGLGLAICQRIVEQYDGKVWVESELGQGSTFRFTLPV